MDTLAAAPLSSKQSASVKANYSVHLRGSVAAVRPAVMVTRRSQRRGRVYIKRLCQQTEHLGRHALVRAAHGNAAELCVLVGLETREDADLARVFHVEDAGDDELVLLVR